MGDAFLILVFDGMILPLTGVISDGAPILSSPTSPQLVAKDAAISFTPTVTSGSNLTWTATDLPAGASINESTGEVSGTCTAYKVGCATLRATNADGAYDEIYLAYHIYGSMVDVNEAYFTTNGLVLSGTNVCYRVTEDMDFDGAGPEFELGDSTNCSMVLNGYSITYDNAAPPAIVDSSFEIGSGWTLEDEYVRQGPGLNYAKRERAWDGDYALHYTFGSGAATRYATNDTSVTLTDGQALCLQLSTWGTTDDPVSGTNLRYAELVGPATYQTTKYGGNYSHTVILQILQFVVGVGEGGTYTLRLACEESAGCAGIASFDDVRLTFHDLHGVHIRDYVGLFGPGTITQTGDAYASPPIDGRSADDYVVAYLTATSKGNNSKCIDHPAGNGRNVSIVHNIFYNNASQIMKRDTFDGYVMSVDSGLVAKNTINSTPQGGINFDGPGASGTTTIRCLFNTIKTQTRYTNGFAIQARSEDLENIASAEIAWNNIDNTVNAVDGGRGVCLLHTSFVGGVTARLHHNTIKTRSLANNQEYSGGILNGNYAIQCEEGGGWEIDNNNVTSISYTDGTNFVGATAFRLNGTNDGNPDGSTAVNIHNNTFTVEENNSPSDYEAGKTHSQAFLFAESQPAICTFANNSAIIRGEAHLVALDSQTSFSGVLMTGLSITSDTYTQKPFEVARAGDADGALTLTSPTYDSQNTNDWINNNLSWYRLGVEDTLSVDPIVN